MQNILKTFPDKETLLQGLSSDHPEVREVNAHFHTPFSFSAFESLEQVFTMAKSEKIDILGINDFYVTDGYEDFHNQSAENRIFPMFNIEFIGLLKDQQEAGNRVNDPNNPGRTYFCGKGLDFPFRLDEPYKSQLDDLIKESQRQVKEMVDKTNQHFKKTGLPFHIEFDALKKRYAKDLVRERHIAKAIRYLIFDHTQVEEERLGLFKKIFEGKELKSDVNNIAAVENELRGNLLKAGGAAFVEEDEKSFLLIDQFKDIIINAGGIPCYPTLLDNAKGELTEFEADKALLYDALTKRGIFCLELIPGRNNHDVLKDFVEWFNSKGFVIIFGTEHNTPKLDPLKVTAGGNTELDNNLKRIAYEGACVVAAHQYLRAKGKTGYINSEKLPRVNEKDDFIQLGSAVIEHFINR